MPGMSLNTSIQVNLIINSNIQFDYQALIIYNAFVRYQLLMLQ